LTDAKSIPPKANTSLQAFLTSSTPPLQLFTSTIRQSISGSTRRSLMTVLPTQPPIGGKSQYSIHPGAGLSRLAMQLLSCGERATSRGLRRRKMAIDRLVEEHLCPFKDALQGRVPPANDEHNVKA
jgi:hypothetical protein